MRIRLMHCILLWSPHACGLCDLIAYLAAVWNQPHYTYHPRDDRTRLHAVCVVIRVRVRQRFVLWCVWCCVYADSGCWLHALFHSVWFMESTAVQRDIDG